MSVRDVLVRALYAGVLGTIFWGAFKITGWGVATPEGLIAYWAGVWMMAVGTIRAIG